MDDERTVEARKNQFGRTDQASNTRVSRFQNHRLLNVNKLAENRVGWRTRTHVPSPFFAILVEMDSFLRVVLGLMEVIIF
jgi:hypothetical protein